MPPEKPKTPNRKPEADDPEPPKKKALRRYEEGEAPAQSVSTVEEHHRQIPISSGILPRCPSDTGNTPLKEFREEDFGH